MNFKTLKEKGEYYRSLTDYRLLPNSYAVIMLDGRSFSHKVKNKFKKPFDDDFVRMMNETTKYLCENIQGALCGYCQSDEIHIVISDFVKHYKIREDGILDGIYRDNNGNESSSAFFTYRISKIQSLVAAMATSKFNNLMTQYRMEQIPTCASAADMLQMCKDTVEKMPLYEFDCKVWNLPNANDVYAWLLYRQIDCIRNSKQQLAQTYLPHKVLMSKHTDEQIEMLAKEKGINWHDFPVGLKQGRITYKAEMEFKTSEGIPFIRSKWLIEPAEQFNDYQIAHINIRELIEGRTYEYKN